MKEKFIFSLPPEWREGKVSGLRARGGITVQVQWKDSQIKATLISDRTQEVYVEIAENEGALVKLEAGKELELSAG